MRLLLTNEVSFRIQVTDANKQSIKNRSKGQKGPERPNSILKTTEDGLKKAAEKLKKQRTDRSRASVGVEKLHITGESVFNDHNDSRNDLVGSKSLIKTNDELEPENPVPDDVARDDIGEDTLSDMTSAI